MWLEEVIILLHCLNTVVKLNFSTLQEILGVPLNNIGGIDILLYSKLGGYKVLVFR